MVSAGQVGSDRLSGRRVEAEDLLQASRARTPEPITERLDGDSPANDRLHVWHHGASRRAPC